MSAPSKLYDLPWLSTNCSRCWVVTCTLLRSSVVLRLTAATFINITIVVASISSRRKTGRDMASRCVVPTTWTCSRQRHWAVTCLPACLPYSRRIAATAACRRSTPFIEYRLSVFASFCCFSS